MIEIPRSVLRQFWQALKRSLPPRTPRHQLPWIVVDARADGLVLHTHHTDIGLRYQVTSTRTGDQEVIAMPAVVLEEVEGRGGNVIVEQQGNKTSVRWLELDTPRVLEQPSKAVPTLPAFPSLPKVLVRNPPRLLTALHEAAQCAAVYGTRYATNRILLRGKNDVVATDGKHLLVQAGFQFPWKTDLLVARSSLFGSNVLPTNEDVQVGRGEKHVILQVGNWTVALPIDPDGRYPDIGPVIPSHVRTTLKVSPADAQHLLKALPKLSAIKDDDDVAVTLDLNGRAVVRVRNEQGRSSELDLPRAR